MAEPSEPVELEAMGASAAPSSPVRRSRGSEAAETRQPAGEEAESLLRLRRESGEMGSGELGAVGGPSRVVCGFPLSVLFIIASEFCERFSFYGMRAILTLYFSQEHGYSDAGAVVVFHAFVSVAYFSPLLGSLVADNFWGRYKVIVWGSVIYVGGHVLLTLGAVPGFGPGLRTGLDLSGLAVVALATGGIKPCVSAFGADQFPPGQHRAIERFFSFFYLSINAGSLLAILVIPVLRGRVACLGSPYCYPLAFGVPGLLMVAALGLFVVGTPLYRRPAQAPNAVWDVLRSVALALRRRWSAQGRRSRPRDHWLDYAKPDFDDALIASVKTLTSSLMIFAPVVVFWALFDQQGSTWVLQARRMNGRVLGGVNVLPDQVQLLNPIFICSLVPLINALLPFFRRRGYNVAPLRRMGVGGLLAAVSFLCAGLVQLLVNRTLVVVAPDGQRNLTLFTRNLTQDLSLSSPSLAGGSFSLPVGEGLQVSRLAFPTSSDYDLRFPAELAQCDARVSLAETRHKEGLQGLALGVFPVRSPAACPFLIRSFNYTLEKTIKQKYRVYCLVEELLGQRGLWMVVKKRGALVGSVEAGPAAGGFVDMDPGFLDDGLYEIGLARDAEGEEGWRALVTMEGVAGEARVALFSLDEAGQPTATLRPLIPGNSVPILYQLPQFFLMSLGEVLFSVSGLEFSYTQAAPSMKSVLQAFWLMTTGLGNSIDMLISGTRFLPDPAAELFFFAGLMAAVMLVFAALARSYVYVEKEKAEEPKAPDSPSPSTPTDEDRRSLSLHAH